MNHGTWESGDWWLNTIISLIITATPYCAIPIIYRFLIRKKPMVKNNAIPLCIMWSFIVCMVFAVIQYFVIKDTSGIHYYPAILYGAINFLILIKGKDRTSQENIAKKKGRKIPLSTNVCICIILILCIGIGVFSAFIFMKDGVLNKMYDVGYDKGYELGYDKGKASSYTEGYNNGWDEAFDSMKRELEKAGYNID